MNDKNFQRLKLGNLIKELRLKKGKTLKDLSAELTVKENTLKRIEEGKFSFDTDIFLLILKKLEVKIEIDSKEIDL